MNKVTLRLLVMDVARLLNNFCSDNFPENVHDVLQDYFTGCEDNSDDEVLDVPEADHVAAHVREWASMHSFKNAFYLYLCDSALGLPLSTCFESSSRIIFIHSFVPSFIIFRKNYTFPII